MQSIVVDGATYTKASVLGKKFSYTTDYIGQLCRAEKVDAKLVGRSWYVREDTLTVHKDSRYRSLRENEITSNYNVLPVESESDFVKIMPVLSKTTKRAVLEMRPESNFINRMSHIPTARYESDEYELLPKPKVKIEPKIIPITIAGAEKVPVRLVSPVTSNLTFTQVPAVVLQGVLPVKSYDIFPKEDVSPIVFPKTFPENKISAGIPVVSKRIQKPDAPFRFTPKYLPEVSLPVRSTSGRRVVLASFLLACVVSFVLVSFDSYVSYDGSLSSKRLVFNAASVGQILYFFNK